MISRQKGRITGKHNQGGGKDKYWGTTTTERKIAGERKQKAVWAALARLDRKRSRCPPSAADGQIDNLAGCGGRSGTDKLVPYKREKQQGARSRHATRIKNHSYGCKINVCPGTEQDSRERERSMLGSVRRTRVYPLNTIIQSLKGKGHHVEPGLQNYAMKKRGEVPSLF